MLRLLLCLAMLGIAKSYSNNVQNRFAHQQQHRSQNSPIILQLSRSNPINKLSHHDQRWNQRLEELKEFKAQNGNVNVPKRHPSSLGIWVQKQRQNYWKGKLSDERIVALNDLGFMWKIGPSKNEWDDRWKTRLEELKQYKDENGHTDVPQRESSLGGWVKRQRNKYKEGRLSNEKVSALNELNFQWRVMEE